MKNTEISQEWIIRSFSSDLSNSERKKLVEWLESDPENFAEYNKLKSIWDQSAQLLSTDPDEFEKSWQLFLNTIRKESKPTARHRFLFLRIAASVAILAGLTATLLWLVPQSGKESRTLITEREPEKSYIITGEGQKLILPDDQTEIRYDSLAANLPGLKAGSRQDLASPQMLELVVPRSRRITLVLADGSKVKLNSESRLRYPDYFTGTSRNVTLEGEAFFDVRKAEGTSFIVSTREISIEVLGTTFNVSAYAGESQISTTLVEGSVALRENGASGTHLLKPSERAVYSIESNTFKVDSIDTELYTSWINGYLKFSSESLEQVIKKLVRNYGVPMEITDSTLKNYKFSGKLGLQETVNQVLNVIQLAAPLDYREEYGTILILNKKE